MKLRIKGNTIRLRLLRSEVDQFAAVGQVSETVEFGRANYLKYSLVTSPEAASVSAAMRGTEIVIVIPATIAKNWTSTNEVGIEVDQPLDDGDSLSILIEKDFECIDRPDDPDRHDAFPNPNLTCAPTE